ncbi:MAG TPA: lyase family protein [Allosphingosinicella sp.]|jgi:argininosuccinate lyase
MGGSAGDTGRIRRTLSSGAARALALRAEPPTRAWELSFVAEVDRAHLVMLSDAGLIDPAHSARLLGEMARLAAENFQSLEEAEAPRGLYLLYESFLIERLGEAIGGALHTGRSRNDLNATVLRLQLRAPAASLLRELLRLAALLLARARRHRDAVMPVYTHGQAALPGSYGHYLAGVAQPLLRSAEALLGWMGGDVDLCPLGAGAAAGTSLPIRPEITAALLGFGAPVRNSLDSVASRDFIVRLLAEAATAGIVLTRFAADLQAWTSAEFGFLHLPDALAGSSSMMPQKRNPYLLEHIQGRAALPLGALVSAVSAMQSKPFTNHIAAGTEAAAGTRDSLASLASASALARAMLFGAVPRLEAMRRRAESGFLEATEISNRLVLAGIPFRTTHRLVGKAITEALERDPESSGAKLAEALAAAAPAADLAGLDPASIMASTAQGGGPGRLLLPDSLDEERARLRALVAGLDRRERQWLDAKARLDDRVERLVRSAG